MFLSEIWICLLRRKEKCTIKMRRPLCLLGLVYTAAVFLAILCRRFDAPIYEALDRQKVVVAGYVDRKEYKASQGGRTLVLSLSDAVILKDRQIAVLEQFLSDSEKIPQYRLHRLWKENKESLQREDTGGIEGVLCYMEDGGLPEMGSLVMVQGDFRAFTHASNPGEFDAANYYRIMGRQGRVMGSRFLAKSKSYRVFHEKMWQLKEYLSFITDACYDPEDASVMKAMLLGEKGGLDGEVKELYRQNGIIHILTISGLHLSILGMGCHRLLKKVRLPACINIVITLGLMYGYGTMTGMGVSMLRAFIMFALHLCAGLVGRTYDLLTAVTIAALVVLLTQPLYIWHSGFLFSFGAVCGIGIFLPAVSENLFTGNRLEKAFLSGSTISISTLPVYLCFYYEFPPYSIILNLIVIPTMTVVLLCGLFTMAASACFLPIGKVMACPVHLFLVCYAKCCDLCLTLPGSRWVTGCPASWQVAVFLAILVGLVVCNHRLSKLHFWQGVLCALLVLTIRMPQGLKITMVDVGQGDCIYLSEEGGMHMMIDGGSSDQSDVASYRILPYLKYEGVSYLDAVVVTHPDSDHINGICTMLKEMDKGGVCIGKLYLPDVGKRGRTQEYCGLERLAEETGVSVRYIGLGDQLRCGKVMLTCLHPQKGWDTEDVNAYSTVIHLSYGEFTALFTGDLEGEGEKRVVELMRSMQNNILQVTQTEAIGESAIREMDFRDITLLKVAHHGSRNSTDEEFLQAAGPKIALVSAGRDNRYGHPHEELLKRLNECGCFIYCTKDCGAVSVCVSGKKVSVETFCEGEAR